VATRVSLATGIIGHNTPVCQGLAAHAHESLGPPRCAPLQPSPTEQGLELLAPVAPAGEAPRPLLGPAKERPAEERGTSGGIFDALAAAGPRSGAEGVLGQGGPRSGHRHGGLPPAGARRPAGEDAWRIALSLLQGQMPRATFESWLRPLRLAEAVGDSFVVEAPSAHACDWLADRLQPTIRRVLSGVTGSNIEVRFIARQEPHDPHAAPLPVALPALPSQAPDAGGRLELVLRFRRYWEKIVDPERVVAVPQYFVRHWLPILGPSYASLVLAFRQLRYLHRAQDGEAFTVTGAEILRWYRVDEATLYRRLRTPHPLLHHFVQALPAEGPIYERREAGQVRRKPRRYAVYGGLPLTPTHQRALLEVLLSLGAGPEPADTLVALRRAVSLTDEQLETALEAFSQRPTQGGEQTASTACRSVWDMIRALLGASLAEAPLEELLALAERLENRIVRPDRTLLLSWYLVQEWQPLLSSAAFWFIALLRSRGFYNRRSQELRDTYWVDGGYAELGALLGVNSETVAGWLGQNRKREATEGAKFVPLFVQEVGRARGRNPRDGRSLSVELRVEMVDPLTPDGESALQAMARADGLALQEILTLAESLPEKRKLGTLDIPENGKSGSASAPEKPKFGSGDSPEKSEVGILEWPENGKQWNDSSPGMTPSTNSTQPERTLSSTTTQATMSQRLLPLIAHLPSISQGAGVVVQESRWSIDDLLHRNHIPPKDSQTLRQAGIAASSFAAWILYCYSGEGKGIHSPGIFAANRLLQNPPLLPRDEWLVLAQRGPDAIRVNLLEALHGEGGAPDSAWRDAMEAISHERLGGLAKALGLEIGER